jgi:hypothetical protein
MWDLVDEKLWTQKMHRCSWQHFFPIKTNDNWLSSLQMNGMQMNEKYVVFGKQCQYIMLLEL